MTCGRTHRLPARRTSSPPRPRWESFSRCSYSAKAYPARCVGLRKAIARTRCKAELIIETDLVLSSGMWVAVGLVMFMAGLTQGAVGFGFPAVSTPILVLMTDVKTAI